MSTAVVVVSTRRVSRDGMAEPEIRHPAQQQERTRDCRIAARSTVFVFGGGGGAPEGVELSRVVPPADFVLGLECDGVAAHVALQRRAASGIQRESE